MPPRADYRPLFAMVLIGVAYFAGGKIELMTAYSIPWQFLALCDFAIAWLLFVMGRYFAPKRSGIGLGNIWIFQLGAIYLAMAACHVYAGVVSNQGAMSIGIIYLAAAASGAGCWLVCRFGVSVLKAGLIVSVPMFFTLFNYLIAINVLFAAALLVVINHSGRHTIINVLSWFMSLELDGNASAKDIADKKKLSCEVRETR